MAAPLVTATVDNRIATLTLNRPEAKNALSSALIAELDRHLQALDADPAVAVLVLSGAGGHFAAGADIREMLEFDCGRVVADDFIGCSRHLPHVSKPVIAAVDGYALGGGCELVEMCDIVIASERARFGHPEVTLATMPGAGGTQRLSRMLGKAWAMDVLLTGRMLDVEEARQCGLVSRVVPSARLMKEARDVATRLAGLSLPVLRFIKEAVARGSQPLLEDGLRLEKRLFHLTFALGDRREGMTAFLERRPARFADG